ncbi:MAG: UDP-N-acetylmuramoyl-L-alanine--D-glutamate ligase [Zetaproteobacteria bacterium]|nr:MAG: UDP-N-acetylmuramoyl-L-alanine--D-glutamate ligase [Zetaproteobacteria bacterium]
MTEIANFVETLCGKPVLVFGLGRTGLSVVKTLKKAGATIVVGDDNMQSLLSVKDMDVEILEGNDREFSDYAFLILSPGIPLTHPKPHDVVLRAQEADIEIICDIELFYRIFPDRKTVGVTGTNGKSTTTTLIHHILHECGKTVQLGGNIGTPVLELDVSDENAWTVLEISSFQMDLCPSFRPDISVVLNLTPDHIDRHGDMEHYMEVKERIVELSKSSTHNVAVICNDDVHTQRIYDRAKELSLRTVTEISTLKPLSDGVYVEGEYLYDHLEEEVVKIGDLSSIPSLRGIHNYQNAACAYAVLRKIGVGSTDIWAAMNTFPGLNHRQYLVRTINGVSYVNDSKSTNAAAAAVALGCWQNVYWIVGGRQKKTGLDGLEEFFPCLKHTFLIGEATEDFADWFDKYGLDYTRCFNLEKAVAEAHEMAQENRGQPGGAGVVLLSPACASFDQFKSFEDRGDKFAAFVNALEE